MNKVEKKKKLNPIANKFASSFINDELEYHIEQVIQKRQIKSLKKLFNKLITFIFKFI